MISKYPVLPGKATHSSRIFSVHFVTLLPPNQQTMEVNLISDTITRPTPAMLAQMFEAEVGDDVFGEDPTINALEQKVADLFGHETALFCPSGTMTNQIAIRIHTQPLDEIICDETSHIYLYELGGYRSSRRGLGSHRRDCNSRVSGYSNKA